MKIFAPLNNINNSAIIVIRLLSNNNILDDISKIFNIKDIANIESHKVYLRNIYKEDKSLLDNILLTYFKSPNSYSGDDIVEFSIHGSKYIFTIISDMLFKNNFRLAEKGEFTKRAFLNEKISLIKSESINDIIASETEMQHKIAFKQFSNDLQDFYQKLADNIIEILSYISAIIDFPEDDIDNDLVDIINHKVKEMKDIIILKLKNNNIVSKIKNGLDMVIFGTSNAGKSTLINYLSEKDISIISDIEGTTRDITSNDLIINGNLVKIYDSAGIRITDDKIEQEAIIRAIKKIIIADIPILLISAQELDNYLANNKKISDILYNFKDRKILILINKIDLDIDYKNYLDLFRKEILLINKNISILEISLQDKINLEQMKYDIANIIDIEINNNINSNNIITSVRQQNILSNILFNLNNFSLDKEIELAAEDLRLALYEVNLLIGKDYVEEILDNIFSNFCIGK